MKDYHDLENEVLAIFRQLNEDENNQEIKGFLENAIKRTATYKDLQLKFSGTPDSIKYYLEQPKKIKVFSWDGEKDTLLSPLDSMRYYKRFLQAGFLAMDPNSGHIKAWVGGIDYKYFQYDHVKTKRQVGSTFKPFVYTAAIEKGVSPCDMYPNILIKYPQYEDWEPKNSDWIYGGEFSVWGALANSTNTVTVQLMEKAGLKNIINLATKMGIETKLPEIASLSLGTAELSLLEMSRAYTTFPN